MKCGACGGDMVQGEVALRHTSAGFLIFGMSYKHLFFKELGKGPKEKVPVLKNGHLSTAYKCKNCGAMLVMPDEEKRNLVHW